MQIDNIVSFVDVRVSFVGNRFVEKATQGCPAILGTKLEEPVFRHNGSNMCVMLEVAFAELGTILPIPRRLDSEGDLKHLGVLGDMLKTKFTKRQLYGLLAERGEWHFLQSAYTAAIAQREGIITGSTLPRSLISLQS